MTEKEHRLERVVVEICEDCISGTPGTCHVPGCLFCRFHVDDTPQPLKYMVTGTPQQLVHEFHAAFGAAIDEEPTTELLRLRRDLIEEEVAELVDELDLGYVPGIAKELADLVYVTYGTAVSLGIDLDLVLEKVHASNMSKLGADGKPVMREDGKVLKGPHYCPPDLSRVRITGGAS